MVTDQHIDIDGVPARWARVTVLALAALLVLVGAGVLYRSTLGQPATAPALRGLSCRWQGHRVVISGTVYNPNASSQTITIDQVVMRLAGGSPG